MVVAYTFDGRPVTAGEYPCRRFYGSLAKDALKPNLIQTLEHTPAIVHGGPLPILHMAVIRSGLRKRPLKWLIM